MGAMGGLTKMAYNANMQISHQMPTVALQAPPVYSEQGEVYIWLELEHLLVIWSSVGVCPSLL